MYRLTNIYKRVERDSYEHGVTAVGTGFDVVPFRGAEGDDLAAVIRAGLAHVGLPDDYLFVSCDSDDPDGTYYVSANRQENADGDEPSAGELERFKAGEMDLYLVDYEFALEHVIRRGVTVAEIRAALPGTTIG